MKTEKYSYVSYENDPYGLRIYTLENGLKVYLSKDLDEPRIKTRIVVKAGATSDPSDATGLAHYVEHMMFKGTDLIGALNREKEESIISKIKSSYEELAIAKTQEEALRINDEIDALSTAASLEAIPGELDKLYSIMGCRGTNARTGFEETVYENDIPKVELERWLKLEKERFTSPVLRLFPPELEVVYEEFNQSQDDDVSRAFDTFLNTMFPRHPYGRAGILGKGEHLKKPSMEKIEEFLNRWYVPSNMALVLVGDLDFDTTISSIDRFWGKIEPGNPPVKNAIIENPINRVLSKTIYGPDSPFVLLGYRFNGFGSIDELYLTLLDMIMSNNQAGTLDLNLVQKQLVLEAESSYEVYRDYSWFSLYGVPGANKGLKSIVKLLLKEIDKLKSGDIEPWYNKAVITCFEIDKISEVEGSNKIESFVDSFVSGLSWDLFLGRIDKLRNITMEELIEFVKTKFNENYVVIYKKKGTAKDILYIKKPNLTPVLLNREIESEFCSNFKSIVVPRNTPYFPDLKKIDSVNFGPERRLFYVENIKNDLFELVLTVDKGRFHNLNIHYAVEFCDYMGAGEFTPKEFQQELFKRGLDLVVASKDNSTILTLSGRNEDFTYGLDLILKFILNGNSDKSSFRKFIRRVGLIRKNAKNSKRVILWGGMYNYLHYGTDNPFRFYKSLFKLRKLGKDRLIGDLRSLFSGGFEIYYYGPGQKDNVMEELSNFSKELGFFASIYKSKKFLLKQDSSPRALFSHYDMVQAEVVISAVGVPFQLELLPLVFLFNEYFGGGMDSVVFQEVRERRGLAYSAYASYSLPKNKSENFMFSFYIGTQQDKVCDALRCILGLLEFFPKINNYFDAVKSSILKNIESEGVLDKDLYFIEKNSRKYGLETDIREFVYNKIDKLTVVDLENFFNNYIKNLDLNYLILGDKKEFDFEGVEEIISLPIEVKSIKSLFGY